MDLLITETNKCGKAKFGDKWTDIDSPTLFAYFGTRILMAQCRMSNLDMYWHEKYGYDPVRNVWSRQEFDRISAAFHINTDPKPDDTTKNRLWCVVPLLARFNANCSAALQAPASLVCDESMLAWRGKHPSGQSMKTKPIQFGFKVWTLADVSGYVYRIDLYCGGEKGNPEVDLMKNVVLKLVQPFTGQYRTIYFDAAFTTIDLMMELYRNHQTLAVGKMSSCRTFPPHVRKGIVKPDQFLTAQHSELNSLSATKYVGTKYESELLSTASPQPMPTVAVAVSNGTKTIHVPDCFAAYNRYATGVDQANRLAAFQPTHRKHYRYWFTFVEHFINVAMGNAWILYDKHSRASSYDRPIPTFNQFQLTLANELIGDFIARKKMGRPPNTVSVLHRHFKPKPSESEPNRRLRCVVCSDQSNGGDAGHKTVWRCTCGAAVCDTDTTCWPKHLKAVRGVSE